MTFADALPAEFASSHLGRSNNACATQTDDLGHLYRARLSHYLSAPGAPFSALADNGKAPLNDPWTLTAHYCTVLPTAFKHQELPREVSPHLPFAMSTISSPRPSIASIGSPPPPSNGSRRTSLEIPSSADGRAASRSPAPTARRNRAALRDYYNLKPAGSRASSVASSVTATPSSPVQPNAADTSFLASELDSEEFSPEAYVQNLLATSNLATVLRAEGSLVSEIKTLDGERKALVYDNYSKLIGAVETIGKMRGNMEEEGKMTVTKTLSPAVGYIADAAGALVKEGKAGGDHGRRKWREQQETVRWVLNAPRRLELLVEEGKREQAEADWEEVRTLLDTWHGVAGVRDVRVQCEKVMTKEGG